MSLPRAIVPGRRYMITRRCSERRFFMRPDRYAIANPVTSHLVARVHHWPGVESLTAIDRNRPLTASKPVRFFDPGRSAARGMFTLADGRRVASDLRARHPAC
jgi:hypothetical protein